MFDWLFNSVEKKMLKTMKEEMENFRDSLKGMSAEEIGLVVAFANHVRISLEGIGHRPLDGLTYPDSNPQYQHELFASVQKLQRDGQTLLSAAMMVWLHTARAGMYLPLRYIGQECWLELKRGFYTCAEAAATFQLANNMTLNILGADSIPTGMERI